MAKVLVLGLDGATLDVVVPWVRAGRLPNFSRLLDQGISGTLRSIVPPMSPPAWTSFLTGKNPGKHGIFDFTERKRGSYETRFINASWRKAVPLWHHLSGAGRRVAAVSVPMTYPPDKVNGIMVSGMDSPGVSGMLDRSATYPPELCDEIVAKVGPYPTGANLLAYTDPREILEAAVRTMRKKTAAALYLYAKEDWDYFMYVIGEMDAVSHRLWKFSDPACPLRDEEAANAGLDEALLTVYQAADEAIGQFLAASGPGTNIVVMSDHGNGPNSDKAISLNRWLESKGLLRFKRLKSLVLSGLDRVKELGLRVLPPEVKRAVFRISTIPSAMESWVRFANVDWTSTVAYSEETPYFPAIWLNVKGRDPLGVVEPDRYAEVCEQIKAELALWRDPYTGGKVVRQAYRRDEIYWGPQVEKAPDVIIDWNHDGGCSYVFRSSRGKKRPPVSKLDPKAMKKAKSSDHREDGMLLAMGPNLRSSTEVKGAEITDMAPTLLYLLGLRVPSDMDGRVLTDLFPEGYLGSHPVQYTDGAEADPTVAAQESDYSSAEEEAISARLKGLGYIE